MHESAHDGESCEGGNGCGGLSQFPAGDANAGDSYLHCLDKE
jgi:hypothetical protein